MPGILWGLGNIAVNRAIVAAGFTELTGLLFTSTSDWGSWNKDSHRTGFCIPGGDHNIVSFLVHRYIPRTSAQQCWVVMPSEWGLTRYLQSKPVLALILHSSSQRISSVREFLFLKLSTTDQPAGGSLKLSCLLTLPVHFVVLLCPVSSWVLGFSFPIFPCALKFHSTITPSRPGKGDGCVPLSLITVLFL